MGSPLKLAFQKLIEETSKEIQKNLSDFVTPEAGTVVAVNGDGTVDVHTAQNQYSSVGSPTQLTIGAQVLVVKTSEGLITTIPH